MEMEHDQFEEIGVLSNEIASDVRLSNGQNFVQATTTRHNVPCQPTAAENFTAECLLLTQDL